jgi:predicted metal-dependent peptidase
MDKQIIREKVQLILKRPFYGSLIVRLQLRDWDLDTFGTDGEYIYCPKKHSFTSEEIQAILAHETLHPALGHLFRCGNRHKMRWNFAADYAANFILENDGFRLPASALRNKAFNNMHAEKIYSKLPDPFTQTMPGDLLEPGAGKGDPKDKAASDAKAKELEQEWKEHLAHAIEKNRGSIPGSMKEFIEDLLFPKISWENILYKYLQTSRGSADYAAYPFNRRHVYREIYLPSMVGDSIEICVGIDSSGSISHQDLVEYFSEVRGICSIFGEYVIHVFISDSQIHQEFTITTDDDLPNFAEGRGGTSFVPVFKRIEELGLEELPLVYFTDLDGDFPTKARDNVFWIVQENGYRKKAPFGEVIEIKKAEKK